MVSDFGRSGLSRRSFSAGLVSAGLAFPAFRVSRAQASGLKVGVLLPRSGFQAGLGQDCHRAVELAPALLKSIGMPEFEIVSGDTESSVQIARAQAEKLINDGCQMLVGAFDSGQTAAIAQVAEQRNIPLVINIAAAPAITEQGYKFVFRNFPTTPNNLAAAFMNQKYIFGKTGRTPRTVVFLCVNDTLGVSMQKGMAAALAENPMPYKIVETISYDPKARDLSVEVAKAKGTGAEALLIVSRLNDSILLTRELIKQRWEGMGILSMGPGYYEDQYLKTLGKFSDGPISFVPWYDPNKPVAKALLSAYGAAYPEANLNANQVYTFEALLVAADAYKRAKTTDPVALAEAVRRCNITDNVAPGPGIQFDATGQNDKLRTSAIQNRGGKLLAVAPAGATNAEPEWPMTPYSKRV